MIIQDVNLDEYDIFLHYKETLIAYKLNKNSEIIEKKIINNIIENDNIKVKDYIDKLYNPFKHGNSKT